MMNELQLATGAAERALRIQPFRLPTRYFLAEVLAETPSPLAQSQALEQCYIIEELAPDYADVTFNIGQLHLAHRRFADALPYLERSVRINPYSADKRVQLAYAYGELRNRGDATRELQQALRLDPGHKQAQMMLSDLEKAPSP